MVICAWNGKKNSWDSIEQEDWDSEIEICLNSNFRVIKILQETLTTPSKIILVSSMYGIVAPNPSLYENVPQENPPSYGVAKAGIIQFTKYLAAWLAKDKITVNCISPGPFPFPIVKKDYPDFCERLKNKNPMQKLGLPDDLKGVFALLSTETSDFITGQNISVDGGMDHMVKIGIVGYTPLNGHPYSFGCIINGFNKKTKINDYPQIESYLKENLDYKDGIKGMECTHVFCENKERTENIASTINAIPISNILEFPKNLDLILILCDYSELRKYYIEELSKIFKLFVDKPLIKNETDYTFYSSLISSKKVMSSSMLIHEPEFDILKYKKGLIEVNVIYIRKLGRLFFSCY